MPNPISRLYCPQDISDNSIITVTDTESISHIATVLRAKIGNKILLFNKSDGEFLSIIKDISRKSITFKILEQTKQHHPTKRNFNVAIAIIKPERMRFLIEKCTEIGCHSFTPIITDRTVIRKANLDKLSTYAVSASQQSGRCDVPEINKEKALKSFLKTSQDLIIYCDEKSNIENNLDSFNIQNINISILIGPEGGFTIEERELINRQELSIKISLGHNILRSETAAIVALTLLKNKLCN